MTSRMMYVLFWLLVAPTSLVWAYETPTHALLSELALRRSVLVTDTGLLADIGIYDGLGVPRFPAEIPVNPAHPVPDETIEVPAASPAAVLIAGAVLEDRGARSLHHFYDIRNGRRGLTIAIGQTQVEVGMPSPA